MECRESSFLTLFYDRVAAPVNEKGLLFLACMAIKALSEVSTREHLSKVSPSLLTRIGGGGGEGNEHRRGAGAVPWGLTLLSVEPASRSINTSLSPDSLDWSLETMFFFLLFAR